MTNSCVNRNNNYQDCSMNKEDIDKLTSKNNCRSTKIMVKNTIITDSLSTVDTASEEDEEGSSSSEFSFSPQPSSAGETANCDNTTDFHATAVTSTTKGGRRQLRSVSFSERVSVRNHLHAADITDHERHKAWFDGEDYHSMYKDNSKIIHSISRLQKQKEKDAKKKAKELHKAETKRNSRGGSIGKLFKKKDKKKKQQQHKPSKQVQRQQQKDDKDLDHDDLKEIERFMNKVQGLDSHEHQQDQNLQQEQHDQVLQEEEDENDDVEDIEEEERRGYSIRGLENEERSKRRVRDQVYLEAKCTVLSIQEELYSHIDAMPAGFGNNNENKMNKVDADADIEEEDHFDVESDMSRKMTKFQQRATDCYHDRIAERLCEICDQSAKDARERGMRDELVAQIISAPPSSVERRRSVSLNNNNTNRKRMSRRWSFL